MLSGEVKGMREESRSLLFIFFLLLLFCCFPFSVRAGGAKSKAIPAPTSAGGGEGGGVWARLGDEEADAFFLAATASTAFFITAALVWRADAP